MREKGVTLMVALIVLVILTLTGIALMRSMDTTNIIAGNLAFQQAATHSGDSGIETAISWLEQNNASGYLFADHNTLLDCDGYTSTRTDPAPGQTWDAWWQNMSSVFSCKTKSLPADAAGNTASYAIERMCASTGDPNAEPQPYCSKPPTSNIAGTSSSQTAGYVALQYSGQVYYRITAQILGPRGTKSYVQAIVAM